MKYFFLDSARTTPDRATPTDQWVLCEISSIVTLFALLSQWQVILHIDNSDDYPVL